jgi:hypothetical protein
MKITIFTLIRMVRLIGFNIQDKQIHVNIQYTYIVVQYQSYFFDIKKQEEIRVSGGSFFLRVTRTPLKTGGELRKGMQFLLF